MSSELERGVELTANLIESFLCRVRPKTITHTEFPLLGDSALANDVFSQVKERVESGYPWIRLNLANEAKILVAGTRP